MKVVISTCLSYEKQLQRCLTSLGSHTTQGTRDIIVTVSGIDKKDTETVVAFYKSRYNLRHVVCHPSSLYEYTSFLAVGEAIADGRICNIEGDFYAMLHDTTVVSPNFWEQLKEIEDHVRSPTIALQANMVKFTPPLRIQDTHITMFKLRENNTALTTLTPHNTLYSPEYDGVSVARGYELTFSESEALVFETSDTVRTTLENTKHVWFPFCDTFNMGVASATFLVDMVCPALKNIPNVSKKEAVDMEMNAKNPLSLKTLSRGRWRYATRKFYRFNAITEWKNDTDVYGDGDLRCVCAIEYPSIVKFLTCR